MNKFITAMAIAATTITNAAYAASSMSPATLTAVNMTYAATLIAPEVSVKQTSQPTGDRLEVFQVTIGNPNQATDAKFHLNFEGESYDGGAPYAKLKNADGHVLKLILDKGDNFAFMGNGLDGNVRKNSVAIVKVLKNGNEPMTTGVYSGMAKTVLYVD